MLYDQSNPKTKAELAWISQLPASEEAAWAAIGLAD
jgi:hypothetical protein